MMRILSLCLLLGLSAGAPALEQTWYGNHEEGWFWYQDPEPEEKPRPEPERTTAQPARQSSDQTDQPETDPLVRLEAIQKEVQRLKARAVLDPTPENVRAWLEANLWQMQQSARFADAWRRVVWTHPELDYSLRRPTMQLASQTWQDERRRQRERTLADVAKTHGLFFFFKSTCPYCHRLAPILRQLNARYGLEILPISMDGGGLPEYPSPRMDNGLASQLGIRSVPALYLVDPAKRDIMPIGFGLMSLNEIVNRIHVLTSTRPGEDF